MVKQATDLVLCRQVYEEMLAQVQRAYPNEGCGLLGAGADGLVCRHFPIANVLQSPVAFRMEPQQQVKAILQLEAGGESLAAIYHSHPYGPPYPSATDIRQASYPEAATIIITLPRHAPPEVRAFTIQGEQVQEIAWRLSDAP